MSDLIDTVSYDQYEDIPNIENLGVKSKIVFSEQAYKFIKSLITKTKKSNKENGCFLVGTKAEGDNLIFYIDFATSEFKCEDAIFENSSVIPTQRNYNELNQKLNENNKKGLKTCVIHFHVHNYQGYYESYSDQDYQLYAKMAKDNNKYDAFGMLAHPVKDQTFGISIVLPVPKKEITTRVCADFYSFPNIYYCKNNTIYKIGTFEKRYSGRKTPSIETTRKDRIIQNFREIPANKNVTGIGKNPNTNEIINDTSAGYIDINNTLYFTDEKLTIRFRQNETMEVNNDKNNKTR